MQSNDYYSAIDQSKDYGSNGCKEDDFLCENDAKKRKDASAIAHKASEFVFSSRKEDSL